jgi:hypothetical protein
MVVLEKLAWAAALNSRAWIEESFKLHGLGA